MGADQDFSDLTILVAEDVDIVRRTVVALLQRMGVGKVLEAPDGRVALDVLKAPDSKVDILFTDIEMPRIDGLTLAQKVKRGDEGLRSETPVVILTANTQDAYRKAAEMRGVVEFLEKPPTQATIRALLQEIRPERPPDTSRPPIH